MGCIFRGLYYSGYSAGNLGGQGPERIESCKESRGLAGHVDEVENVS